MVTSKTRAELAQRSSSTASWLDALGEAECVGTFLQVQALAFPLSTSKSPLRMRCILPVRHSSFLFLLQIKGLFVIKHNCPENKLSAKVQGPCMEDYASI